ncbi:hypothetical protein ANANG_G00047920 [Anguilla anguilla]|uniref:Uncharacterized protein n=1 Tax=Anguilla anguilla TaxID=7936 RepID=A0A9D3S874_ANGAN|nr:hypothetical protein ANANG_G00047920 [Anguilla anguilla]
MVLSCLFSKGADLLPAALGPGILQRAAAAPRRLRGCRSCGSLATSSRSPERERLAACEKRHRGSPPLACPSAAARARVCACVCACAHVCARSASAPLPPLRSRLPLLPGSFLHFKGGCVCTCAS